MADDYPQGMLMSLLGDTLTNIRPVEEIKSGLKHLAHYTSVATLQNILKQNKLWFSHPLFMNDRQEMSYGIQLGLELILRSGKPQRLLGEKHSADYFTQQVMAFARDFSKKHALDVYLFCLTEHELENKSGLLSMWRAYGESGKGAAIVFNTKFLREKQDSVVLIAKVSYVSDNDRIKLILEMLERWCEAASKFEPHNLDDAGINALAQSLFVSVKIMALTTKHVGFSEEREWRLIYMPDHDPRGLLKEHFSYNIGVRGIEPKLKMPIEPIKELDPPDTWTFVDIVDQIILGPGMSAELHSGAVRQLLKDCGKEKLLQRICFSEIPLRLNS